MCKGCSGISFVDLALCRRNIGPGRDLRWMGSGKTPLVPIVEVSRVVWGHSGEDSTLEEIVKKVAELRMALGKFFICFAGPQNAGYSSSHRRA